MAYNILVDILFICYAALMLMLLQSSLLLCHWQDSGERVLCRDWTHYMLTSWSQYGPLTRMHIHIK